MNQEVDVVYSLLDFFVFANNLLIVTRCISKYELEHELRINTIVSQMCRKYRH